MKTPQVAWGADVARHIAHVRAERERLDMASTLAAMKRALAAGGHSEAQTEAMRESIADLEEILAEYGGAS